MATEKQTFSLDSFLPQNCMSRAEAFAKCLQDKLKSLGGSSSEEYNKKEKEDKICNKNVNHSDITNLVDITDDVFVQNPNIYQKPQKEECTSKKTRKHRRISRKNLPNGRNNVELSSDSDDDRPIQISRLEEHLKLNNNYKQALSDEDITPKLLDSHSQTADVHQNILNENLNENYNRFNKTNSEDSAVESTASWCSCEESIGVDNDLMEADDEDNLLLQVRGSPGIKKFRRHKGKKSNVGKTKRVDNSPPEQEVYFDFDVECFSPENEPEDTDLTLDDDIINTIEDYEVPHRILRESSSAGDLEHLVFSKAENCRNYTEFRETAERSIHTLSSECLRLSASPECQSVLTPPPSPASKRNSQDSGISNIQNIINYDSELQDVIETDVNFNDIDNKCLTCNECVCVNDLQNPETVEDETEGNKGRETLDDNKMNDEALTSEVKTELSNEVTKDLAESEIQESVDNNVEREINEDVSCPVERLMDSSVSQVEECENLCKTESECLEDREESIEILEYDNQIDLVYEPSENDIPESTVQVSRYRPYITVTDYDDDADYEELRPQVKLRRCSSLKSWKTPPGTPGRKKIVRFADALGLDLADVRTFLDEIPKVPNSAYDDLKYEIPTICFDFKPKTEPKTLIPLFQQPGGQPDFITRIQMYNVCLENATVTDPTLFIITGLVRVKNLDYHKIVQIRYTIDNWASFSDLQATYVQNSCDGFSDKFSFVLYGHTLKIGQRIEFAIRYQCKGYQFWDNNLGYNYTFQCVTPETSSDSSPLPSNILCPTTDEQWPVFY